MGRHLNNPREGCAADGAHDPANPQADVPPACTGRDHEQEEAGPLLCDGRHGHRAGRDPRNVVVLGERPELERQLAWRGIKHIDPGYAAVLRDDPFVAELRRVFGASPVLSQEQYRRYLRAGEESNDASE